MTVGRLTPRWSCAKTPASGRYVGYELLAAVTDED